MPQALEQIEIEPRELKEFNLVAQVNLLEDDLIENGEFTDSKVERIRDEESTHVVEGINGRFITKFPYEYKRGHVVAIDGTPILWMIANGRTTAEAAARSNPADNYHLTRAIHDEAEAIRVEDMMAGRTKANTLISFSTFPEETADKHGAKFVEDRGYSPGRKLAFMRVYHRQSDGTLEAMNISLDNSNLEIFRNIAREYSVAIPEGEISDNFLKYRIELLALDTATPGIIERIREQFDAQASARLGYETYFGRKKSEAEIDAWEFVKRNQDLIETHLDILKGLALRRQGITDIKLHEFIKRAGLGTEAKPATDLAVKMNSIVGIWSAMKQRLDKGLTLSDLEDSHDLMGEVIDSRDLALINMEAMPGCGGSIDLSKLDEETALSLIFAENAEDKKWCYISGICMNPPLDHKTGEGCPSMGKTTKIGPCSRRCIPCEKVY